MTMFESEISGTGHTGAKRTSWEHYNPRDLVIRLVRDYPNADDRTLARHLHDRVLGDEQEYLLPILLHFVRNTLSALERSEARKASEAREKQAAEEREDVTRVKDRVTEHVRKEAEKILLDLEMPNGKLLRDCTGKDCTRFGGWYRRLAKSVGPRKLVGAMLSEEEVRKLYTSGQSKPKA
jgi:hypothetical protein